MPYLIDTNVLIEAHRRYYAFDVCPGFWDCLLAKFASGEVKSVEPIRDEIAIGDDDDPLKRWVLDHVPESVFNPIDADDVQDQYKKLVAWTTFHKDFTSEAKAEFATKADGWLIAYALANGLTVVTHEELRIGVKKRVPIPNVCNEFGVAYRSSFDMLRELKVQFHWADPSAASGGKAGDS